MEARGSRQHKGSNSTFQKFEFNFSGRRTDNWSTHWRIRRRTDNWSTHLANSDDGQTIGQLTCEFGRRTDNWSTHWRIVSRQDEGSNSTFQKLPAKTRVRIQLFKSFPAKTMVRIQLFKVRIQLFTPSPTITTTYPIYYSQVSNPTSSNIQRNLHPARLSHLPTSRQS